MFQVLKVLEGTGVPAWVLHGPGHRGTQTAQAPWPWLGSSCGHGSAYMYIYRRRLRRAPGRGRFVHVFCTPGSSPMHDYHCGLLRGVFVASCMTLRLHCGTCADVFWNLVHMLLSFLYSGGLRGSSLALLRAILAHVGIRCRVFLTLWGVVPKPSNTFEEQDRKTYHKASDWGARRGVF